VLDLLLETLRSLRAHALRFGLTSLGIVWGAFMLTYLSATMEGTDRHFTEALQKMGPRIVFMGSGTILKQRVGERGARRVELEREDVERIETLRDVEHASPSLDLWSTMVRTGRRTKLLHVQAVGHDAGVIRNLQVERGRFLSPLDVDRRERVVFLGAGAAERLFGRRPAVGKRVQIEGVLFRVIGVARAKGHQLIDTVNPDDQKVWIPYTTAQRWITKDDEVAEIVFGPRSRERSKAAIERIREVTAPHHGFRESSDTALWFFDIQDPLQMVRGLLLALRVFLVAAGVTTLLIGAVGVMNIMLVVVGERTSEIGLRKAVGGSTGAVFAQFLAEATAVCALSGLVGAGLGMAAAQIVASLLPPEAPMSSVPVLDPTTALTLTLALVAVGVVAGLVPAIRAARIPPAEALRRA